MGTCFDSICEDPMFGTDTWEAAESTLQKQAALLAIQKRLASPVLISGCFLQETCLAQTAASSFGTADLEIPFYGLFGACSTMGESLSLGSMCIRGRIWKTYPLCNFQPLCQRRKRISFSPGIWKSETLICYLDCHRCRSLCTWV